MKITFVLFDRNETEVARCTVRLVFVNCLGCLNLGSTVKLPEAQPFAHLSKWLPENDSLIRNNDTRLEGTRLEQ